MVTQHPLVTKTYESIGALGNEAGKLLGFTQIGDFDAPTYAVVETTIARHFRIANEAVAMTTMEVVAQEYPHDFEKYQRIGAEVARLIDKLCKLYPDSPLATQLKKAREAND